MVHNLYYSTHIQEWLCSNRRYQPHDATMTFCRVIQTILELFDRASYIEQSEFFYKNYISSYIFFSQFEKSKFNVTRINMSRHCVQKSKLADIFMNIFAENPYRFRRIGQTFAVNLMYRQLFHIPRDILKLSLYWKPRNGFAKPNPFPQKG